MRNISFSQDGFQEYFEWSLNNKAIYSKITDLIKEITRNPFKGKGKPEPLKGKYSGYWSRRITDEHRLIYKVEDSVIYIAKCKGHYT
jgi:toxin YoeB